MSVEDQQPSTSPPPYHNAPIGNAAIPDESTPAASDDFTTVSKKNCGKFFKKTTIYAKKN